MLSCGAAQLKYSSPFYSRLMTDTSFSLSVVDCLASNCKSIITVHRSLEGFSAQKPASAPLLLICHIVFGFTAVVVTTLPSGSTHPPGPWYRDSTKQRCSCHWGKRPASQRNASHVYLGFKWTNTHSSVSKYKYMFYNKLKKCGEWD